MKKITFLSLIGAMFLFSSLHAQAPTKISPYTITWSQCFGGDTLDIGFSLCEFDTSELLLANYTYSDNGTINTPVHGNADWWAMKFTHSTTPQLVWSHTYGGSLYDKNRQICPSYNHKSYALFGTTHSKDGDVDKKQIPKGGDKDNWWLLKINDAGTILKQKLIVGHSTGDCGGRALLPTSDNGYILLGWSNADSNDFVGDYTFFGQPTYDGWLFKVDSNLNIQWKHNYGGTGADAPIRLIRAGNYYYFTGFTTSNDHDMIGQNHPSHQFGYPSEDFGVWKTDTMGNLIWGKSPGGSGTEFPFDIKADWDGNILCAGYTSSTDGNVTGNHGGAKDGWLFKLNAVTGALMWEKCFGGTAGDAIKRILPMPDHGYLLLLTSSSGNDDNKGAGFHGKEDVNLIRTDSNLNVISSQMFGGSGVDDALDIQEFPGQGYMIMGNTTSTDGDLTGVKSPTTGQDLWLFFVADATLQNGNTKFSPTAMQITETIHPDKVIAYPSVTTGLFTLQSKNAVSSAYEIRITDADGKEVWTKSVNGTNAPVNEKIDLSNQAKGTYLVQILFVNGNKQTLKIIVQ